MTTTIVPVKDTGTTTITMSKPVYKFNHKVVLKNDDHNSFDHVVDSLCKIIPGMNPEKAETHAIEAHSTGATIVYEGHQEPCEMYAEQLRSVSLEAHAEG
jgi:ATP-dependent Clp protease adaptor protein ClpS